MAPLWAPILLSLAYRQPFFIIHSFGRHLFKRIFLTLLGSFFLSVLSQAQSNDFGISVGGVFSPNSGRGGFVCPAVVGAPCTGVEGPAKAAFSLEGAFAHRLLNLHLASFHLELPVLGTTNRTASGTSYSAIFFTPGLKVRFSLPAFS